MRAKLLNKIQIKEVGPIKIFTVNGSYIRTLNPETHEFGDFSIHEGFPNLIPKREVWIDESTDKREIPYFIENAVYRIKLLKNGYKYEEVYEKAKKKEQAERDKHEDLQFNPHQKNIPLKIYMGNYGNTGDRVNIKLVDGNAVRDQYRTNFIEGGHHYVYKWIPENEIWIDDEVKDLEKPLIVLHEYSERCLMKNKKMKYDKAHEVAAQIELGNVGKFSRDMVERLNLDLVNKMIDNMQWRLK